MLRSQVIKNDRSQNGERYRLDALKGLLLRTLNRLVRTLNPHHRQILCRLTGLVTVYRSVLHWLLPQPAEGSLIVTKAYGFKMYLDGGDDPGYLSSCLSGNLDPASGAVFRQALTEGDIVVDVGAHWGYYTLLAASLCGSRGRVFAFEPHPANFHLLTKSVRANGLTNVVTVQKAVSDRAGMARLSLARYSVGHSICPLPDYLRASLTPGQDALDVETTSLDLFFHDMPLRARLVKIDAEGAELRVLRGMQSLTKGNPSLVLIAEFHPAYLDANAVTGCLEMLASGGFEIGIIDHDRRRLHVGPFPAVVKRLFTGITVMSVFATRDQVLVDSLLRHAVGLGKKWVAWRS